MPDEHQRRELLRRVSEKQISVREAAAQLSGAPRPAPAPSAPATMEAPSDLVAMTAAYIETQFARRLGIEGKIGWNDTLEPYGVDSIKILELVRLLEKTFGPLPKTLLFEHNSIRKLTDYLVNSHESAVRWMLGLGENQSAPNAPASRAAAPLESPPACAEQQIVDSRGGEPIAIVGVAIRFPGASTLEEFWDNLSNARSSVRVAPADRWGNESGVAGLRTWGGFIDEADKFDPAFFGISPREAEQMDPQERLFLEIAWQTLEDAGYTRQRLVERCGQSQADSDVGVFAGVMYGTYQLHASQARVEENSPGPVSPYWSIANRVSYYFNFHGPSMAIDTACSASSTAIHLACESIRRGECHAALAGGVTVITHPRQLETLASMKMLSRDAKCRAFGAGADGLLMGEGAGAVLLRPLDAALRDGDRIYGVIRGNAINTVGKTGGYTVPDPVSQSRVISAALRRAQVAPETVTYIETHGTGTALGDPIEVRGLSKAFEASGLPPRSCAIGAVKSNIGHLQAAAGIAGLVKVLLQFRHRKIAPTLNAEEENPYLSLEQTPFYLPKALQAWEVLNSAPLRAGVSSFGIGGANAHLLLEEAPTPLDFAPVAESRSFVVPISARNATALRKQAARFQEWLRAKPDMDLRTVALNWQLGREAMEERVALLATDRADLDDKLASFMAGKQAPGVFSAQMGDRNHPLLRLLTDILTGTEFVDQAAARGQWDKLAALWVAGFNLDWARLHPNSAYRRVSMPGYPFERKRYWLTPSLAPSVVSESPAPILTNRNGASHAEPSTAPARSPATNPRTARDIRAWMVRQVATELKMDEHDIDPAKPFNDFGVDSLIGASLTHKLGAWLGVEVNPTILWEYPTITAISAYLEEHFKDAAPKPSEATLEPEEVLARIDQLTEKQIDACLNQLLPTPTTATNGHRGDDDDVQKLLKELEHLPPGGRSQMLAELVQNS